MSVSNVLIAGCGDVGSVLARGLASDGHRVTGIRRNTGKLPACIHGVAADLSQPQTLSGLPRDINWLVYSAAADASTESAYQRAYVHGLSNVLQALDDAPLARILFISSSSVYGQDDGSWVDENAVTAPGGFSGQVMLRAESVVHEWAGSRGVSAAAVRFAGIYGPGRTRLLERVRCGTPCDPAPLWTNRIHRDDCAGVLAHLLRVPVLAPIYLGVDCEPAPQCEVMDWLAGQLGCQKPPRRAAAARRRGGNKRCSNLRLLDSGYRFTYPGFRDGYAAMLQAG